MRGAPHTQPVIRVGPGIIPADAGSTLNIRSRRYYWGDHPRGCGEHLRSQGTWLRTWGSSPRMRGAPWYSTAREQMERIIPADAGSTYRSMSPLNRLKDHPRGCGEHYKSPSVLKDSMGSSPRMRGALLRNQIVSPEPRIIPADAGSTADGCKLVEGCGDHPRGCGEHKSLVVRIAWKPGSSPRMRGARETSFIRLYGIRIIPADAGSTYVIGRVESNHKDHPRGCGEHRES